MFTRSIITDFWGFLSKAMRPLLASLCGVGFLLPNAVADAPNPAVQELRVVSFNIKGLPNWLLSSQFPVARYPAIGRAFSENSGVDILLLQEAFSGERSSLFREAAFPYLVRGPGKGRGFGLPSGLFLLTRFPVLEQAQESFGSHCLRWDCFANKGVQFARLKLPGTATTLEIFNTHLQADRQDPPTRVRQAEILVRFFRAQHREGSPVLFVGDFNFRPGQKQASYAVFQELGLEHAGRFCLDNGCTTVVDQGWQGLWERAVDHQFYRAGRQLDLRPIHVKRSVELDFPDGRLSDHLPLEVRYRLLPR